MSFTPPSPVAHEANKRQREIEIAAAKLKILENEKWLNDHGYKTPDIPVRKPEGIFTRIMNFLHYSALWLLAIILFAAFIGVLASIFFAFIKVNFLK